MKKSHLNFLKRISYAILIILAFSCNDSDNTATEGENDTNNAPLVPVTNPLFPNSIVSTNIDFIKADDPDAFVSVSFKGLEDKEMPDSRNDQLFDTNTFVFDALFTNNKIVGIWVHSSFGSVNAAKEYVDKLTSRLGKLPEFMRDTLSHVIIHKGDAGAFSESVGHFFVLYSDNMDTRISNNDLEETVFHETIHASLDEQYATSTNWTNAQSADVNFITDYGKEYPIREDMSESAIFAYTMLKYPGRLSTNTEEWVRTHIPNRFAFFETIFLN